MYYMYRITLSGEIRRSGVRKGRDKVRMECIRYVIVIIVEVDSRWLLYQIMLAGM